MHEDNEQVIQYKTNSESNAFPDSEFVEKQWALAHLKITDLWQMTMGSEEILVAVLDTGIDTNHEDLQGKLEAEVNFTESQNSDDIYGHGTPIAGIIAAGNNQKGILGLAPDCRLLNVKVADDRGRCDVSDLVEGIVWAVNNGADVINISIEINEASLELETAINYAWQEGVVVVAAAGNSGTLDPVYPAYYENCISVTAIKDDNSLSPLSNRGQWIDLAAPGYQIFSTLPGSNYGFETGTSFASAHVSGVVALLLTIVDDSNNDGFKNDEVLEIIKNGSQKSSTDGSGWSYIDTSKMLAF